MIPTISAVIVGADRLGNIPNLLRDHNIAITHHISGRDPSHQKKTLQLPTGTQMVIATFGHKSGCLQALGMRDAAGSRAMWGVRVSALRLRW